MRKQSFLSGVLAACLLLATMPGRAEMIGTPELLAAAGDAAQREQVRSFLSRADVQQQLVAQGVDPVRAAERANALTGAELQQLAGRIEELPAGAGAIEIALLVVLILLVLELAGAIDIFTQF